MSNFASGYVKYINHLEQINDAAVSDPARMIDEVEDATTTWRTSPGTSPPTTRGCG